MSALMGYNDGNWGAGEWLAMGTMMLVFWGLVIGLVVWAVRSSRSGDQRGRPEGGRSSGADTLLAERYARGEIDEDEFLRRRDLLHSAAGPRSDGTSGP
jgi:putative membrane protein